MTFPTLDTTTLPPNTQYLPRSAWGLTDDEADRRGMDEQPLEVPELYVHHTAGSTPDLSPAEWDDDPIRLVQVMDERARNRTDPTYRAVAYSVIIHHGPDGITSIVEGRGDRYPGATSGRNTISKAVCLVGNFDSVYGPDPRRSPHPAELEAARWVVNEWRRVGILADDVVGRPHRDNPSCPGCTACPGDRVTDDDIAYIMSPIVPPPPPDWSSPMTALYGYDSAFPRLVDTRPGQSAQLDMERPPADNTFVIPMPADAPIPAEGDPGYAIVNVTVLNPAAAGYLVLWGDDLGDDSTLNYDPRHPVPVANMVLARLGRLGLHDGTGQAVIRGMFRVADADLIVDLKAVVA